jgi:hypothetical protein
LKLRCTRSCGAGLLAGLVVGFFFPGGRPAGRARASTAPPCSAPPGCAPGSAAATACPPRTRRSSPRALAVFQPSAARRAASAPTVAGGSWPRSRCSGDRAARLGQRAADRLDPELLPVRVDVGDHGRQRRSSSAAKKPAAVRRIAFVRRSSAFSRSSCRIRADSAVVVPGRSPASICARFTQPRCSLSEEVGL